MLAGAGLTQAQAPSGTGLTPSTVLRPLPQGAAARELPIVLEADRVTSRPGLDTVAEGKVDFRRGSLSIMADRLSYDTEQDLARAEGHVRIRRPGANYSGPELQLRVQSFEGYFLQPEFEFTQIGAGGRAYRIDFLDSARSKATLAEYTSCPREGDTEPAWLLRADSVEIDLDRNEGIASGGVLRFLGVPILAAPSLSFPLSDARKSGWLPPSISTDSRSGIELAVPYYWNIAPNRDATLTPRLITRRGVGLDSEFRYLEPRFEGSAALQWLPNDRVADRSREALRWRHDGNADGGLRYGVDLVRVSDDGWWKDFPGATGSLTPRLLPMRVHLERPFALAGSEGLAYVRSTQWQVLQGSDVNVVAPYQRTPQIGVRLGGGVYGLRADMEAEYNHFDLPAGAEAQAGRARGERVHLLASLSRPWREPGWWVVPKLSVNAARYGGQGASKQPGVNTSRVIPSLSVDAGLEFERSALAFGRDTRQTLEPRVLYVRTPYREQSGLPNYDAAAKDFNFASIYTDNQFSGVDRVNDAHQLTAGVTTRLVDASSGAEMLRLGLAQRVLFRNQRITAKADGTVDGPPLDQRLSDLLLLGSTSLVPKWTFDAALQYSPDLQRSVRSIIGARYSPAPFRTVSATYRLTRGLTEQIEMGWQWPLYGPGPGARSTHSGCAGTWYSVGRVNYSTKDSRITDAVLGFEYDAGCWIGRFVAERLSTGRSEATTRVMLQLELVGLSRLGSNPLQVLKDNIPGYRLLRGERNSASPLDDPTPAPAP